MRISDWSSDVCSSDLVAVLAEVSINKDQGIDVDRIFCAVDCGRVVNPDLVRQQIEGGIIFALSGAVAGGVTWSNGLQQQTALADMGLPRMSDAPELTVQLMETDAPRAGVRGSAVPPVAPAIANAVHA